LVEAKLEQLVLHTFTALVLDRREGVLDNYPSVSASLSTFFKGRERFSGYP
jgi:hypothetical protein